MKEKIIEKIIKLEKNLADYTDAEFRANFPSEARLLFREFLDEYADWKIKECLPEKNNTEIKATGEGGIYEQGGQDGWNACIDQTLINKDKIK